MLSQKLRSTDADALLSFWESTNRGQLPFWFTDVFETVPPFRPAASSPLLGNTFVGWDVTALTHISAVAILTAPYPSFPVPAPDPLLWKTNGALTNAVVLYQGNTTKNTTGIPTGWIIQNGTGFWLMDASPGKNIHDPANVLDWTAMTGVTDLSQEGTIEYGPESLLFSAVNPVFLSAGHVPGVYSVRFDTASNGLTRTYSLGREQVNDFALLEVLA